MGSIVAAQTSVAGVGGHDFWILKDDNGNEIGQIHGWAFKDGQIQVTAPSGRLIASKDYFQDSANAPQQIVLQGSMAELQKHWDAALKCTELINNENYEYSALSLGDAFNSNNVYSTIGACMGVDAPNVGSAWTLTPGFGEIILEAEVIDEVLEIFGIGGGSEGPPEDQLPTTESFRHNAVTLVGSQESLLSEAA